MKNIKSLAAGLFIYGMIAAMAFLVANNGISPESSGAASPSTTTTRGNA